MKKKNARFFMEMIDVNTIAAILSFISLVCLLLANLSATIIDTIYFISVSDNNDTSVIIGLYGYCVDFNHTSYFICSDSGLANILESNVSTKFLLSMHTIGNSCLLTTQLIIHINNNVKKNIY